MPPDPKYSWGATFYGEKGVLKAGVYRTTSSRRQRPTPVHKDVTYEFDKYPEDKTEKDLETHVAPAVRYHMKDFLAAIDSAVIPSRISNKAIFPRHRASWRTCHETGQDTRVGPTEAQSDWRSGGQRPIAPSLSPALETAG